jgi:hypothetical protein
MEKSALTRANLSDVRVIMAIMRVLVEELLFQATMGWILVLECLFLKCAWVLVVMSYHV